jgi:hypothetical protein
VIRPPIQVLQAFPASMCIEWLGRLRRPLGRISVTIS